MLYCPNFFWNVLQVWMTGKDVYLQTTWSWPDKTWNILCSYCLQWNTSQSKFRNHYFLFLFAFSILSQLFLIWGSIIHFDYKIITEQLSATDFEGTHMHTCMIRWHDHLTTLPVWEAVLWNPSLLTGGRWKHMFSKRKAHTHTHTLPKGFCPQELPFLAPYNQR